MYLYSSGEVGYYCIRIVHDLADTRTVLRVVQVVQYITSSVNV
jgi:hypothetical protein